MYPLVLLNHDGEAAARPTGNWDRNHEEAYAVGRPLPRYVTPLLFFNDVSSRAPHKRKDITPFVFGNLKSIQRRMQVA